MLFTVAMLIIGLGCTRSKYYGEFILAIFFILLYKPGMMRNFKLQHALLIIVVLGLVVAASWSKISFYFITGNSDTFDPDVAQSYARPVLFATAGLILVDHFPFGSGLASFASYASAEHYSNLYYEYGINNVWGLSEDYNDFICDAYFPALAQFGFVGVILFVVLFSWIYSKLRLIIRANGKKYRIPFSIGVMCISFVMIESVGSTFFVQTSGMLIMILLGLTASLSRDADVVESVAITKNRKSLKIKI